jgi:toxin ParE1/3/4
VQIKISKLANDDLIDIWLYGSEVWGVSNADAYIDEIDNAIRSLTSHATRYPEYKNETFRLMPHRSHLIAYDLFVDYILIGRVLHKNMDTRSKVYTND